jgi:uncharacterized membrane protein
MNNQATPELRLPIPFRPEQRDHTVSVRLREDDRHRLQALADVAGVTHGDSEGFAEVLASVVHRGLAESYRAAGLLSPPHPAASGAGRSLPAPDEEPTDAPSHAATPMVRRACFGLAAVATVVLIVGSYAGHWTWTGLTRNGQVWDWMQLLLLPVALGTFPLWLRFSWEMSPVRREALGGAVLSFAVFVLLGYLMPLTWTGFRGHTLWDWLTLIVLPISIATATIWRKTGRKFGPGYRIAVEALLAAWIVTLIGGYARDWRWTGYPGNTLWDWVQLLLAPVAITTWVVPALIRLVSGSVGEVGEANAPAKPRTDA